MADKKISELTEITDLTRDDLFLVVNDSSGTPNSRRITHQNLFGNVVSTSKFSGPMTVTANTTINGSKITIGANGTVTGAFTFSNTVIFQSGITFPDNGASTRNDAFIFNNTVTVNSSISLTSTGTMSSATAGNIFGNNGKLNANNTINAGSITVPMLQETPIANTTARTLLDDRMQVANTLSLVNDRMQVANILALNSDNLSVVNAYASFLFVDTSSTQNVVGSLLLENNGAGDNFSLKVFGNTVVMDTITANGIVTTHGNVQVAQAFSANTVRVTANTGFRMSAIPIASEPSTSNAVNENILAGTVWFSNNYLYIATDSNSIRRVSLSTF